MSRDLTPEEWELIRYSLAWIVKDNRYSPTKQKEAQELALKIREGQTAPPCPDIVGTGSRPSKARDNRVGDTRPVLQETGEKQMRVATKELLKELSDSVKIYEISYSEGEPRYKVEVNGVGGVVLHLDYMTAYEEAREAMK